MYSEEGEEEEEEEGGREEGMSGFEGKSINPYLTM